MTARTGLVSSPSIAAAMVAFSVAISLSLWCCAAAAQPAPFHAFLDPEFQRVGVGGTARVAFAVDSTAMHFNGYELTIRFDPAKLSFLDIEQGQLMEEACGNTPWFVIETTDSTVVVSHVVMCAGVSVDGPGELSVFTFETLVDGVSEIEILTDPDYLFFDAGIYVNPAHPTYPRQVTVQNAWVAAGPNQTPTCDAGGPYAGTAGDELTLDGSASTDDFLISSYEWDFGDGGAGSGAQPTHTWTAAAVYTVTLCVTDNEGAESCCTTTADIEPVIGIEERETGNAAPARAVRLAQNRPNPFNPSTEIVFELAEAGPARLAITSPSGRCVWQRTWDRLATGEHRVRWSGRGASGEALPSGFYVYELSAGGARLARKMLLLR